jgi:hypothetical protein
MKKIIAILTLTICANFSLGQNVLVKDIDLDGKSDTVYIDAEKSTIVCNLSSMNYKPVVSKPIEILNETSGIAKTKNGFEFFNSWMRAGYKNQFRYNSKTKKIQLIGMSRYEFGNAVQDGSGESSVNLLTGDYIGNWNYFDIATDRLVKIPTIRKKMNFKPIILEEFSDDTYFNYAEKCAELYNRQKTKGNQQY